MKPGDRPHEDFDGLGGVEDALRGLRREVPPEGLAAGIASRLAQLPPPRRSAWRELWEALQRPQVVWAYRLATFLVLVGIMAGVWRVAGRKTAVPAPGQAAPAASPAAWQAGGETRPSIPVTFTFYNPRAQSVCVVSTFNDWDCARTPMTRGKDGTWSVKVSLPQGKYEYMFLVDGSRYETDPNAMELRQDGMGNENAVLRL